MLGTHPCSKCILLLSGVMFCVVELVAVCLRVRFVIAACDTAKRSNAAGHSCCKPVTGTLLVYTHALQLPEWR